MGGGVDKVRSDVCDWLDDAKTVDLLNIKVGMIQYRNWSESIFHNRIMR